MNRHPGRQSGNGRRALWLLAMGLAFAGVVNAEDEATPQAAPAPEPAMTPPGREYKDFQLINDRNIFNPNRTRRSRYDEVEAEKPREPKIEIVALTGTLSYTRGTVAFFDSTSSEFRKAAKVGDEIAGYRLKEITQSQAVLERESELLRLKVGQQLRRQDEGPWEITSDAVFTGGATGSGRSSRRDSSAGRPSGREEASAATASESPAAASASSEGPSEVLKRLLEQRRKEQAP